MGQCAWPIDNVVLVGRYLAKAAWPAVTQNGQRMDACIQLVHHTAAPAHPVSITTSHSPALTAPLLLISLSILLAYIPWVWACPVLCCTSALGKCWNCSTRKIALCPGNSATQCMRAIIYAAMCVRACVCWPWDSSQRCISAARRALSSCTVHCPQLPTLAHN
jgi:hypothetical protein